MKDFARTRYSQENVQTKQLDRAIIKRLLSYLYPYRYLACLSLFCLICASIIEAWIPIKIGQAAQLLVVKEATTALEKEQIFNTLVYLVASLLVWSFINYAFDIASLYLKNWVGQKAIFNLRIEVYRHIIRLPMSFLDKQPIGRLMTRTIHDIDQINQLLSESLVPLIGSFVLFLGIFIGVFFINWEMGIVFCLIFPLIILLIQYFRIRLREGYSHLSSIASATNSFIQENLMGAHIIRHFGLYSVEQKKYHQLSNDFLHANLGVIKQYSFFFSTAELLKSLMMIGAFLVLAYVSVTSINLQLGVFFTISIYTIMIFRPLLSLAERYNVLQSAMASAERVFELLDRSIEVTSQGKELNQIETIEFNDVWFAYEEENWILKGLTFKLDKGETLAVVGPTGSGKTTIINLLLRYYDFQKGKILINGEEINAYSVDSLRNQFNTILQEPTIFSGTLYDNLTFFNPTITKTDVEACVNSIKLDTLINRFPEKLNHMLSEQGGGLSVGELQLVALARAMLHQRSVLILDEATANIDIYTEKVIQEGIRKVLENQTAIVIAHRLTTVRDSTRIIVLSNGKIAESGSHQELLEKKGIYEKLFRLQFAG